MYTTFADLEPAPLSHDRASDLASRCVHHVDIAIGRAVVSVRFARRSAAEAFARRFGDMLAAGEAGFIAYAADGPDESVFWTSPERALRWRRPIADHLLVFFADIVAVDGYLKSGPDLGLHAAVVANRSSLVAILGGSTAGKTTTAIAAARDGFTLYSDERCIVQEGLVVPFLRALTIRAGGRTALLHEASAGSRLDDRLRAMRSDGETQSTPSALFGRSGGPPRGLDAIFVIAGRSAEPFVERCPLHAILPDVLRSMASRDRGLDRAARVLHELGRTAAYRLRLGKPRETVRAIESALIARDR